MKQLSLEAFSFFRRPLAYCAVFIAALYLYFRLFFFEFGLSWGEEVLYFIQLSFLGMTGLMSICFAFEYSSNRLLRKLVKQMAGRIQRPLLPLIAMLLLALSSCKQKLQVGIKKDLSTGITTQYKNLLPEDVLLVMNGEVINHHIVPLGQDFTLINKNVNGFEVRDEKISVGCSLKITDEAGKLILDEHDLFANKPIFNAADAGLLKCNVSTGRPMEWQKQYKVSIRFWDKFGDGQIENTLVIDIMDEV